MKRLCLTLLSLTMLLCAYAEEQQKFSPEKFDADLQEYIIREAKLTSQEAKCFFPVYREMQCRQRGLYEKQRKLVRNKPQDETSCQKAICERDDIDLEIKRLQKSYHERFLEFLPASKVYEIIQAEDRFHRHMFKHYNRGKQQQNAGRKPQQREHNQK